MGIIFWWMLPAWIVLIAGYWLVRYFWLRRWKHKTTKPRAIPVAHSNRLAELPEYKIALQRYRFLIKVAGGLLTAALLMAILLTARPATISVITPAQRSRDIMLCLDASGSLLRVDAKILGRFSTLAKSFSGQRFGLTVFNSSAISILPLSEDYQLVNKQLTSASAAFAAQKGQAFIDLTSGTLAAFDKGTSLVGDGVASCIGYLGQNVGQRSQSIILATDNEANGTPIVSLPQVGKLADQRNIRIYAIDPGQSDAKRASDHAELKTVAQQTGGDYYTLQDSGAIASIIDEISRQEAKYAASLPVVAVADKPLLLMYVAILVTVASLALMWRLQI